MHVHAIKLDAAAVFFSASFYLLFLWSWHEQHMLGSRKMGWRLEVYLALSKNVNRISMAFFLWYIRHLFLPNIPCQGQFFIYNIVKCPQCIRKFGSFYCLTLTLWSAMQILLCYWAIQSHKWQHLWYLMLISADKKHFICNDVKTNHPKWLS